MTVKIPATLQAFMPGKQGWVATASADGMPNIAIKGSLRLLDDEHLVFADLFSLKTRKNLEENTQVAVMVFDSETRTGYSLKGHATVLASGPVYDQVAEAIRQHPAHLPPPKYVVQIAVEAIYNQSLGPEAGQQIA